jgi:hypothetical protein
MDEFGGRIEEEREEDGETQGAETPRVQQQSVGAGAAGTKIGNGNGTRAGTAVGVAKGWVDVEKQEEHAEDEKGSRCCNCVIM